MASGAAAEKTKQPTNVDDANVFSYLIFAWVNDLLRKGEKGPLKQEDLPRLRVTHQSVFLVERLRGCWQRELEAAQRKPRREGWILFRAMVRCFLPLQWLNQVLLIIDSSVHVLQAVALGWLISYFSNPDAPAIHGWGYAALVVACGIAFSFAHHHFFMQSWILGMQLRLGATGLIYDKLLRLRLTSLSKVTTGHVVNLCTADVERFQLAGIFINYLWEAPLEALVILYFGIHEVGVAFLSGFGALLLLVPLQALCSRFFAKKRAQVAALADERIKLTSQAIVGARLVKISGWENAMTREIRNIRGTEISTLMKATQLRAFNEAIFFAQPAILTLLIFLTYHAMGNTLTPPKVFVTLALLNITQFSLGKFLYMAVQSCSEAWVAVRRIERFLLLKENEPAHARGLAAAAAESAAAAGNGAYEESKAASQEASEKLKGSSQAAVVASKAAAPEELGPAPDGKLQLPAKLRSSLLGGGGAAVADGPDASATGSSTSRIVVRGASFHWEDTGEEGHGDGSVVASGRSVHRGASGSGSGSRPSIQRGGSSFLRRSLSQKRRPSGRDTSLMAEEKHEKPPATPPVLTLASINLEVLDGELLGVVGPVGAAKSSLLMALMQEMTPVVEKEGEGGSGGDKRAAAGGGAAGVLVEGRIAYASQEAWIQSGTLRSNVLFGRPYNAERYEAAIRACALEADLAQLPNGDMTVIGDRGVNLSGGQKARVGLARLCYSDAEIFVLDDPLSAVDPAVGRRLFAEAICGLLAGRTRILVTHQVQYLSEPEVDRVLVMRNGHIAAAGRYPDLVASGELVGLGEKASNSDELAVLNAPSGMVTVGERSGISDAGAAALVNANGAKPAGFTGVTIAAAAPAAVNYGGPLRVQAIDEAADEGEEGGNDANGGNDDDEQLSHWYSGQAKEREPSNVDADAVMNAIDAPMAPSGSALLDMEALRRPTAASRGERSPSNALSVASQRRSSANGEVSEEAEGMGASPDGLEGIGGRKDAAKELVGEEEREIGEVQWTTYVQYARLAAGLGLSLLLIALMALGQALVVMVTVWLGRWSAQSPSAQDDKRWARGLGCLVAATLLVSLGRAAASFWALLHASHVIHDRMLIRVLRAPLLFFDSNPAGRILNRFSKDIGYLDDMLPATLYDYITCAFMVLGSTLLICIVNPWIFLSLIPTLWYFRWLLRRYMTSSREIKRLDAVTRSPVYGAISETLDGLVTIRAYGQQQRFLKEFHARLDENTKAYFAYIFTSRWLGFRLDAMVLVLLGAAAFVSVAINEFNSSSSINPGMLGAALIYVLQLGGLFQWAVRQAAEVENQMISVERTLAYTRVDQEAALESSPDRQPPPEWPEKGHIVVKDLWATYREGLPPVLRGLSYEIPGGSRCGVVGRTGAGKSSFVAALFRLLEYDSSRGGITLDGRCTAELGLHDLRPRMSAIPQTPFLFSGSVRLNMDPFQRFDDAAIWAALEAVQMKTHVAALAGGISASVAESGSNFSVGQRQLLCMARAILNRSKVLVLDEATANIDLQTDNLIQEAVRSQFLGCTVIMIAHRLATIIDADLVIVLDHGTVAEQGHPYELLQRPDGAFASMVAETGEQAERALHKLAKDSYYSGAKKRESASTDRKAAEVAALAALESGGDEGRDGYANGAAAAAEGDRKKTE